MFTVDVKQQYNILKNEINKGNTVSQNSAERLLQFLPYSCTVKILKFGTPQTIAIIVLKIEKFDVTLH